MLMMSLTSPESFSQHSSPRLPTLTPNVTDKTSLETLFFSRPDFRISLAWRARPEPVFQGRRQGRPRPAWGPGAPRGVSEVS